MSDYKSNLKMTEEQTLKFIQLYGKEAVLWDCGHSLYRCKTTRREVAKRIATDLSIEGFGVEEVVKKFKNLRSAYCQELKKIEVRKKIGETYVPRVIWFATMNSFIRPFVSRHWWKHTQSNFVSNSGVPDKPQQKRPSSEGIQNNQRRIKVEPWDSDNSLTAEIFLDDVTDCEGANSGVVSPLTVDYNDSEEDIPKRIKIEAYDSDSNSSLTAARLINDVTKMGESSGSASVQNLRHSNMEDCFDNFGKYIASVLRKLPLKNACLLQQEMTQLAMDAVINSQTSR